LLKEIVPTLSVVALLRVPSDPNVVVAMESLERVAPKLGVSVRAFDVSAAPDLGAAFAKMKSTGIQAVLVVAGAFMYTHGRTIAEWALTNRLPPATAFRETAAAGGLFCLGRSSVGLAQPVAPIVNR